jgi:hypothetical protein
MSELSNEVDDEPKGFCATLKDLEIHLIHAGLNVISEGKYLSTVWKIGEYAHHILIFLSDDSQWITYTVKIMEKDQWKEFLKRKNMEDHEMMKILLRLNAQHNFGKFALDQDGNIILLGQIINTRMEDAVYRQYILVVASMLKQFLEITESP